VSKHIIVKPKEYKKALLVDQVDIDGKNNALTWMIDYFLLEAE
jgi:hypothetical protein